MTPACMAKDPVQTNRDLATCRKQAMEYVGFGNEAFRCMRAKGNTIIGAYT